jgi:hypothetical protein
MTRCVRLVGTRRCRLVVLERSLRVTLPIFSLPRHRIDTSVPR